MSAHTPGPWHADLPEKIHPRFVRDTAEVVIAYCDRGLEEAKANARLIAAAPELLEACKTLVAARDGSINGMAMMTDVAADQARAAIAKATTPCG
jgi:hypothetical protein